MEVRGEGWGGRRKVSRPGRAPGKTCEVDECRQEAGKDNAFQFVLYFH